MPREVRPSTPTSSASSLPVRAASTSTAATPPPRDVARKELDTELGGGALNRTKLSCNLKMAVGIFIGVVVGLLVMSIIVGALLASHGTAIPLVALIAAKVGSVGTAAAQLTGATGFGAGVLSSTVIGTITTAIFFGGGCLGDRLFRSGERDEMDKVFKESKTAYDQLAKEAGVTPTEDEIAHHTAKDQSTILTSQVGRNFIEEKRRAGLHFTGPADVVTSPVKAFGRFWTSTPAATARSVVDRKQYDKYLENYDREVALKNDPTGLTELNQLRGTQITQLLWNTDTMGDIYAKVPELVIIDRNIARLETLREKVALSQPGLLPKIDDRIAVEKAKAEVLITSRLTGVGYELDTFASKTGPVQNLLTIERDIRGLGLPPERTGQLLEAVAILIAQKTDVTIHNVNALVQNCQRRFPSTVATGEWKTREAVIQYAAQFARDPLMTETPPFSLSNNRAPMLVSRDTARMQVAKLLAHDVVAAAIHATPIPGSSGLAAGVTAHGIRSVKKARDVSATPTPDAARVQAASARVLTDTNTLTDLGDAEPRLPK